MREFNGVYSCRGASWVDMGFYLMLPALNAGATAFLTAFQCSFVCPVSMFSPPRNCNTCSTDSAFMMKARSAGAKVGIYRSSCDIKLH